MKSVWLSLSAGEIVRLLKSDKDALRELSAAIASEPKLRLAVINAVLADVAAKQDLQQLRQELKGGDSAATGGVERGHNSDKTRLPATKTGVERGDIAATGGDRFAAATC
jgi:hypothetical protein